MEEEEIQFTKKQKILFGCIALVIVIGSLWFYYGGESHDVDLLTIEVEKLLNVNEYLQERLSILEPVNITDDTTLDELKDIYLRNQPRSGEFLKKEVETFCPEANSKEVVDRVETILFINTLVNSTFLHSFASRLFYIEGYSISSVRYHYNSYRGASRGYLKWQLAEICYG